MKKIIAIVLVMLTVSALPIAVCFCFPNGGCSKSPDHCTKQTFDADCHDPRTYCSNLDTKSDDTIQRWTTIKSSQILYFQQNTYGHTELKKKGRFSPFILSMMFHCHKIELSQRIRLSCHRGQSFTVGESLYLSAK
jgi:hypothetical protein